MTPERRDDDVHAPVVRTGNEAGGPRMPGSIFSGVVFLVLVSFSLSKFELTFEEYDPFTEATGRARAEDEGWGRGRRPVINVSWADAVAYTKWLSALTGRRYSASHR